MKDHQSDLLFSVRSANFNKIKLKLLTDWIVRSFFMIFLYDHITDDLRIKSSNDDFLISLFFLLPRIQMIDKGN